MVQAINIKVACIVTQLLNNLARGRTSCGRYDSFGISPAPGVLIFSHDISITGRVVKHGVAKSLKFLVKKY